MANTLAKATTKQAIKVTWKSERTPVAGQELYRLIRSALALSGKSFQSLCKEHNVDRSWGYQVVIGKADGLAARELRRKLCEAAGLGK